MARTTNKRTLAARKAVRTRNARREFVDTYGETTVSVVRSLVQGVDTADISWEYALPRTTVAAIAANYTRGTYDDFVNNCNF